MPLPKNAFSNPTEQRDGPYSIARYGWRECKKLHGTGYNKVYELYTRKQFFEVCKCYPEDVAMSGGSATEGDLKLADEKRWYNYRIRAAISELSDRPGVPEQHIFC